MYIIAELGGLKKLARHIVFEKNTICYAKRTTGQLKVQFEMHKYSVLKYVMDCLMILKDLVLVSLN